MKQFLLSDLKWCHATHQKPPTRNELTENTNIIARAHDRQRLTIKEAFSILHHNPAINKQFDNFNSTIKLHPHRNIHTPQPLNISVQEHPVQSHEHIHCHTQQQDDQLNIQTPNIPVSNFPIPSNNPVSPGILNRINNLILNQRHASANNPSFSPMRLRSATSRLTR